LIRGDPRRARRPRAGLLREEIEDYKSKSASKFVSAAFSEKTLKLYMLNSYGWWRVHGKRLPTLRKLAMTRTQRCKPSSSSAERNWSIWGVIHSKLRNRLVLGKAMMLVFMPSAARPRHCRLS
jgi:hypothetical protein